MKKILSAAVALALALSMVPGAFAAGGTAYASTQAVEVDGTKTEFQMYALKDANGDPTNYVKLRDVAHVLNGTKAQFSVGYDGSISVATGQPYADTGAEMKTPYSGDRAYRDGSGAVKVNGQAASLESIILTDDAGGDYTYFKLRDLGAALGFKVDWINGRGVVVETGGSVQPAEKPLLEQMRGIWYGQEEGMIEEVKIEGDQFRSTTSYNGSYSTMAATIDSVEGSSGEYRFALKNGTYTMVDEKKGSVDTGTWENNVYWFYFDPTSQTSGSNLVAPMTRVTSQQLYPLFQAALEAAQG